MSTISWLRTGAATSALAVPAALLATATPAAAQPSLPAHCEPSGAQVVCTYDEPGEHTFTVPDGLTEATFEVYGAQGGKAILGGRSETSGGLGGFATATIPVSDYETLLVRVGGRGGDGNDNRGGGAGGFNGGGDGGRQAGGGGGGASDVRTPPGDLDDRIIVAGGGGAGADYDGGAGGGQIGGDGAGSSDIAGGGGTQSAGGTGGALPLSGEDGAIGRGGAGFYFGGGGGGGYFGGGGAIDLAGGGGGSGYITPEATNASMQTGVHEGDGLVVITYTPPVDEADLAIAKQCTPGTVAPGATVDCTVTVTNSGPADATGVTVTDQLGDRLTLTGAPSGDGFDCTTGGGEFSCTRDQLAADESVTIGYTVAGAPDLSPGVTIYNTAEVTAVEPNDPDMGNNTTTATVATPSCTIDHRDAFRPQAIVGTPGADVICGSSSFDGIRAGGGDDIIFGRGGSDGIHAGPGMITSTAGPGTMA